MEHSVAINPVEELKPRATGEGPAWAEADSAAAAEAAAVAGAAVVAAAEVVEEAAVVAEAAAEAVGDDASWRFGPLPRILRNRNVLKEPLTNRD